jgi:hypothetical protein
MMPQQPRVERKPPRSWSVPVALGFGPEAFDGAAVLDEMHGEQALLVWQILRDVDLWLAADRPAGRRLFSPGAGAGRVRQIERGFRHDNAAHQPLQALATLLRGTHRDAGQVSAACAALARWASEAGLARTAFAAALRAAASSPRDPGYCHLAGVMARRSADYLRAEAWLRRSLALARRVLDGRHYGLSLMSLANLHMMRYQGEMAERRLRQALKAARRFAIWDLRALAFHDLFMLTSTHGHPAQAARYALAAARGYGRFHPRLPALAHDVAWFLLRYGHPARALRILQALDDRSLRAQERLLVLSSIGRAAGAAGDAHVFWRVWTDLWQWLDTIPSYDRAAEALVNLGWGAAHLGDATRVEVAAREALRIAGPRDERQEIEAAERMLASLAKGRVPEPPVRVACSDAELADAVSAAEMLIEQLLEAPALRESSGDVGSGP